MIIDDIQKVIPGVFYKNTQSAIEAMSLPKGSVAYATDAELFGTYSGSQWTWGAGGGKVISAFAVQMAQTTPPNQTHTKVNGLNVLLNYGSHWDAVNHKYVPPDDSIMIIMGSASHLNIDGSSNQYNLYKNGVQILNSEARYYYGSYQHHDWSAFAGMEYPNGTDYYEVYTYRWSGSGYLQGTWSLFSGICMEV